MEPSEKKVLVVDDYQESRTTISNMLAKLQVDVVEAADGESALNLMVEHQPVVVLLDADMPDLDGYQVLNRMQTNEKARHLPVILMTSNLSDRKQKLHQSLMDVIDFVNKPINETLLIQKVEAHLELDHYRSVIRTLHSDNEKLLEAMHEGVLGIDAEGMIRFANSAAAFMLRASVSSLQDTYVETIFEEPNHQAHSNWAEHPVSQVIAKKSILQVEKADFWRADGSSIKVKFAAVPMDDLDGMALVLAFKEISEDKESKKSLSKLTNIDYLTGLPSRVRFEDLLDEALKRASGSDGQLAVMIINIDHFRYINDSLGHEMGDKLLNAVKERVEQTIRKNDVLARIGGDEFALLIEPLDSPAGAGNAAVKIIDAMKHVFLIEGHEIFSSCSMGIATYPACGDDRRTLLKNADAAVARAKELGRNSYQYYSAEINTTIINRINLEHDLHQALPKNQMTIHYEPIVTIDDENRCVGVGLEAQLRWHHPDRGLSESEQFMGVAEDIGLFSEMTQWMYRESFAQMQSGAIHSNGLLFAYMSPQFLAQDGFIDWFTDVLTKHGISGDQVVMEICETVFMRRQSSMLDVLTDLHGVGVKLTITDFGIGYGSLEMLRKAPINVIRLPGHFVTDLKPSSRELVICKHIVSLAHELGIKVWAGRVNERTQFELLRSIGIDYFQGELDFNKHAK